MKIQIKSREIVVLLIVLALGIFLGYLITPSRDNQISKSANQQINKSPNHQIYTCSMHPQIRQPEPGKCPICGMDLIPLEDFEGDELDPDAIVMTPTAMKLAEVATQKVGKDLPEKTIRLTGKIQPDERLVYSQSSHIPGRIERLMVNFTGEYVKQGQPIAYIYSPDLVTAQQELLETNRMKETQPQLFEASREKLRRWKLTDKQIDDILQTGNTREVLPVLADISGIVTEKLVNLGDYIKKGDPIYQIVDLSKIWVMFDVYETDIHWITKGDKISFTVSSLPGEEFIETIDFIDPVINPQTRVAKARVELTNKDQRLKPEMFVTGRVESKVRTSSDELIIPKSAVLWTGKRSVVYVKTSSDLGAAFKMREINLGPSLGEAYVVESGLKEGEEIAVNGTFSIDAAAQLAGKPSMMNPETGKSVGKDHAENNVKSMRNSTPSQEFTEQLNNVYKSYLPLQNVLFDEDIAETKKVLTVLKQTINKVNMSLVSGEMHQHWMELLGKMNQSIHAMETGDDLEEIRKSYSTLSDTLFSVLKMFGTTGGPVYRQFCPMAFGNEGAYWLSDTKQIHNPYFGEKMATCGYTEEEL